MPSYIFYDNNCGLSKIVKTNSHFSKMGLPVDVFHFKSKHKDTDKWCQENCNPADFPELMDGDKWRFNSSIAEQTNVWLGGYHTIVREMGDLKYNFFLDRMMVLRDRLVLKRLQDDSHEPGFLESIDMLNEAE
ncbi:hypothetical protein FRC00_002163 [Tulasnella sp. 408]|nr:hypothetical protein FRC00_002163 [Tulasnella sp. 408]